MKSFMCFPSPTGESFHFLTLLCGGRGEEGRGRRREREKGRRERGGREGEGKEEVEVHEGEEDRSRGRKTRSGGVGEVSGYLGVTVSNHSLIPQKTNQVINLKPKTPGSFDVVTLGYCGSSISRGGGGGGELQYYWTKFTMARSINKHT